MATLLYRVSEILRAAVQANRNLEDVFSFSDNLDREVTQSAATGPDAPTLNIAELGDTRT